MNYVKKKKKKKFPYDRKLRWLSSTSYANFKSILPTKG